ncbi:beta strand repeat-containing protein [Gemmata sp.]|uniref:beta strand repeat-containing protein n=1 Tax=Gemmata sp. TaxID=1914242 RepID=UPI003F7073E0
MPRPWWIRSVARTLGLNPASLRGPVRAYRPQLQTLEDRATPAVVTYDNPANPTTMSIELDADREQLSIRSIGSSTVRFTVDILPEEGIGGGQSSFAGDETGHSFDLVVDSVPVQVSIIDAPTITGGVVNFLDSGANAYPAMPTTIVLDNGSRGIQFTGSTDFGPSALSVTGDTTISFRAVDSGAAHLSTTADLLLAGDRLDLQTFGANASTINAGTATVRIRPASSGQEINIGGGDLAGFLGLTDNELDRITAGAIEIGSATAGGAKITAPISPAKTSNISITTGKSLYLDETFPGGSAITVGKLTLSTGTGAGIEYVGATKLPVVTPIPIDVDNLEATGAGSVYVANTGNLTIGGASAAGGIDVTGTGAVVSVATTGTLTVNEALKAGGSIALEATGTITVSRGVQATGDVALTATGGTSDIVTQGGADNAVASGGGTATLRAGRHLTLGTSSAWGDVSGEGLVLEAGGDIVLDNTTFAEANGAAGLRVTAGGDVKILHAIRGGSILNSNSPGANVTITTGPGKSFILDQGRDGGVGASTDGDITINSDNMVLSSGRMGNSGTGTVTLKPRTAGRAISLGAETADQLSLLQAELDLVTVASPVTDIRLQIGDATAGAITVAADLTRPVPTHLTLASGGTISPATTAAGAIDTNGGSLTLAPGTGGYTPVRSGTDATALTASFASGSDLSIVIDGTAEATDYTQFVASGTVDLTGVGLVLSGDYSPVFGDVFTVVSAADVDNEFTGLAEGAMVSFGGRLLRVHYTGTAVTLTVVDETAPDTQILTGPTGLTKNPTPTFTFSGTDTESGVTEYRVSIDGGKPIVVTGPSFTTRMLGNGPHTISVAAVDAEGNVDPTPATAAFTVDATRRFDMKANSIGKQSAGWDRVMPGTKYSAATGYGWATTGNVGGSTGGRVPAGGDAAVLGDYAYGLTPVAFKVFVGAGQAATVTVHTYAAPTQGLQGVRAAAAGPGGTTQTLRGNGTVTVSGTAGADGVLTVTFSVAPGSSLWIVNAVEVTPTVPV